MHSFAGVFFIVYFGLVGCVKWQTGGNIMRACRENGLCFVAGYDKLNRYL